MKLKIFILPLIFLLIISLVSAAFPVTMHRFFAPQSTSSTTAFINLTTVNFETSSVSNITAIGSSFLENTGGTANTKVTMRAILDGVSIGESGQLSAKNGEKFTMMYLGNISDLPAGNHTVTIQRSLDNADTIVMTINDFIVNTNIANDTTINNKAYEYTASTTSATFEILASGTFENLAGGDVRAAINGLAETEKGTFIFEYNNQNSSEFSTKKGFQMMKTWIYENSTIGTSTWNLYGLANGVGTVSINDGKIILFEFNNSFGNIDHNFTTKDSKTLTSSFTEVLSTDVKMEKNESLYAEATWGQTKGGGNSLGEFFIRAKSGTISLDSGIYEQTFAGGEMRNAFIIASNFTNLTSGIYNVSLFAKDTGLSSVMDDISLSAWEFTSEDFDVTVTPEPELNPIPLFTRVEVANSVTATQEYSDIAFITFSIDTPSDILILTTLTAGLGETSGIANYRILFDGIEIDNKSRSVSSNGLGSISINSFDDNILSGGHNVTLQHKISNGSILNTQNIEMIIDPLLFNNNSRINLQNFTVSGSISSTNYTALLNQTYTPLSPQNSILSLFESSITTDGGNDQTYRTRLNNILSPSGRREMENAADIGSVSLENVFTSILAPVNMIFEARTDTFGTISNYIGKLFMIQGSNDGFNQSILFSSKENTNIEADDVFRYADGILLNISNSGASIFMSQSSALKKSGAGIIPVSYHFRLDDTVISPIKSRNMDGASDFGSVNQKFVAENISIGIHNISVFYKMQTSGGNSLDIFNMTLIVIETQKLETSSFILFNDPVVSLIAPDDLSLRTNVNVTFEATITDSQNLTSAQLFTNQTGIFSLISTQSHSGIGTTFFFNETYPEHASILWNIKGIDNESNEAFASSNFSFTINIDETAPIITLITPANNTSTNIIPLNITFSASDFSSNLTCILQNSSFVFDAVDTTPDTNTNLTLASGEVALEQKFENLELSCSDNSALNLSSSLSLNYTLDTNPPIINIISPSNNTIFNNQITGFINFKANCTDTPAFRLNISISNSSDLIDSFESFELIDDYITIDENLDITALGSGNYTTTYTCADTHTGKKLKKYNTRKYTSEKKLEWEKGDDKFSVRYDSNNTEKLNTFKSTKQNDRYLFNFKTNKAADRTGTYTFLVESENEIYYIEDSKYSAHFIIGDSWIDFEFDDKDALYNVWKNRDDNYVVEITTKTSDLNFNSVGDLNLNTITTEFEIINVPQQSDHLTFTECKTDTGSILLLWLLIAISMFFVVVGFATKIGFFGVLGSILLMTTTWLIAPCSAFFSFALALISFMMIIWFAISGLGFTNKTFSE